MHARRWLFPGLVVALLTPGLANAQSSIQDFKLGGSARVLSQECIRLTPDQPYTSGSAWFNQAIDLKQSFEMRLDVVLGKKDVEGADGIVFVFHPTPQTGFRGEGMGFAGLVPSVGIELDTYQNFHLDDPFLDHVALMSNGESFHGGGSGTPPVEVGNLEDGQRHPLRITWKPGGKLQVYLDNKLRAAYSAEAVMRTFGGQSTVYWGMTAATGRLSNAQDVCIEKLFIGV
ncbi:MAG: L-type lectin-domain containing protein [Myxococcota bacterium]